MGWNTVSSNSLRYQALNIECTYLVDEVCGFHSNKVSRAVNLKSAISISLEKFFHLLLVHVRLICYQTHLFFVQLSGLIFILSLQTEPFQLPRQEQYNEHECSKIWWSSGQRASRRWKSFPDNTSCSSLRSLHCLDSRLRALVNPASRKIRRKSWF